MTKFLKVTKGLTQIQKELAEEEGLAPTPGRSRRGALWEVPRKGKSVTIE